MSSELTAMIGVLLAAALINLLASSPHPLAIPAYSAEIAGRAVRAMLICNPETDMAACSALDPQAR